jgi:hypothetical protein
VFLVGFLYFYGKYWKENLRAILITFLKEMNLILLAICMPIEFFQAIFYRKSDLDSGYNVYLYLLAICRFNQSFIETLKSN